ncbi:unnamed protein product [marine sediment metagenome]|uniref:Uncharacterized protein n=1 Tax=marine sediment metagenome TaxID=412755 RepID=X1VBX8_9ZZZZ
MRIIIVALLVAVLSPVSTSAQEIEAVTKDNRRVILYPNGTWKYVEGSKKATDAYTSIDIIDLELSKDSYIGRRVKVKTLVWSVYDERITIGTGNVSMWVKTTDLPIDQRKYILGELKFRSPITVYGTVENILLGIGIVAEKIE